MNEFNFDVAFAALNERLDDLEYELGLLLAREDRKRFTEFGKHQPMLDRYVLVDRYEKYFVARLVKSKDTGDFMWNPAYSTKIFPAYDNDEWREVLV